MKPQTGFDELLMSRVNQLKEIDERIERAMAENSTTAGLRCVLQLLRHDIVQMIAQAEREHAAF